MIVLLVVWRRRSAAGFIVAERRAREPTLPLSLFRNRVFTVSSMIGFIVGFALFGSVTYIPLYLQIVEGASTDAVGPRDAAADGRRADRVDRQRTADLARRPLQDVPDRRTGADGRWDAAALAAHRRARRSLLADLYMLVLGLGLGFVMQVLVLAVQNAVDYRDLGVATASATLFRSMGGTIGVPIFGAIFTNQLATNLAHNLPPGAAGRLPSRLGPESLAKLPARRS